MTTLRAWAIGLCVVMLWTRSGVAHPAQFTALQIKIEPSGQFQATLNIDLLAFALGKTSAESSNEELEAMLNGPRTLLGQRLAEAGTRFRRELVIHTDSGDAAPDVWRLPGLADVEAVLARKIQPPILMPGEIAFSGALPAHARTVSIRLPYTLGDTIQIYELPQGHGYDEPVTAGSYSSEIKLGLLGSEAGGTSGGTPARAVVQDKMPFTTFPSSTPTNR